MESRHAYILATSIIEASTSIIEALLHWTFNCNTASISSPNLNRLWARLAHISYSTNTMTGTPPTDLMTGPAPTDQDSASASIATESRFRSARTPAFSVPKDFKQAVVKLDNIDSLIGQSNYED